MKNVNSWVFFIGISLLLMLSAGKASAYTINFSHSTDGNELISPYYQTTEDFEGSLVWTWTDNYAVVDGSTGINAAPYGVSAPDASHYVTVPESTSSSPLSATATLGGTGTYYNYFGLWWGSVDTYNTITFLKDGTEVLSLTGSQVITPTAANGNQTAPSTNLYVNFLGLDDFNQVMLTSTQYAFEADNMTVNPVPIPAALWLLGSGIIGLVGIRKKQRKA